MKKFALLFVLTNLFALCALAQIEKPKPDEKKAARYRELLGKLKKGDTALDFKEFRLTFTETSDFSPYSGSDIRKKMNEALDKKDYNEALKVANERLQNYYVDIDAHITAFISNRELGNTKESVFHETVFRGLVDSILDGADGKTAKTAFFVISIREEYIVMMVKGLRVGMQALKREDGHTFDVLTGTDPEKNETASFYFNIDKVFGRF